MDACQKPRRITGAKIVLSSGNYYDFESPETSQITLEDYAWGLASFNRFAGHVIDRGTGQRTIYTICQHVVLTSLVAPKRLRYQALMHESGATVCGDMTASLKRICPDFEKIEKRCESSINRQFGVPELSEKDRAIIKRLDLRMLATEKRDLLPASVRDDSWECLDGIRPFKMKIVPWPPTVAIHQFLIRYDQLRDDHVGGIQDVWYYPSLT
jgi:hypothetical protein